MGVSLVESEVLYKNMDHSDGLHINIAFNKWLFFLKWLQPRKKDLRKNEIS